MKNNNGSITRKLIIRSFQSNKGRNVFIILAIMLTTILITSVFSIGMSFMEANKLQTLRYLGTTADANAGKLTATQTEKLKTLDYIKVVGEQFNIGTVKNTKEMSRKVSLDLIYFDKVEWGEFRAPTNSDFVGTYPEKYGDVMMPLWTLDKLGITNPKIGMEIPIDYYLDKNDESTLKHEAFTLSGYYTDYMSARGGGFGYIAVSENFAKQSGKTAEPGYTSVQYTDINKINEYNDMLTKDLSLTKDQKVEAWLNMSQGGSTNFGLGIFVGFIMLVGYLLIYNVLYISVSKDIRFYGLLKSIGTTPKQLKKIVTGQALLLAIIGIPLGLLVGVIISIGLVPFVLSGTVLKMAGAASFNPLVFIGAAFFALITIFISTIAPSRKASKISPIEAIKYTEQTVKSKKAKTASSGKINVMAWRNVFRDKKRAFIVLISLFLGITVFLVTNSLIKSMSMDSMINATQTDDFDLLNYKVISAQSSRDDYFNEDFIKQVKDLQGVENIDATKMDIITVKYNDDLEQYVEDYLTKYYYNHQTKESIIADFKGVIYALDTSEVQKLCGDNKNSIDIAAFERGEFALVETDMPDHFANIKDLDITISLSNLKMRIPIGGFIPWNLAKGKGAPSICVSKEALKKWSPNAPIGTLSFNVDDQYEETALSKMKELVGDEPAISLHSKLERKESMSRENMMLSILGNGFSAILGLIGILNFVNITSTSIMARRRELAMLESIGMTKKQINKMLYFEGLSYAIITAVLISVFGSAITYGAFLMLKQSANFLTFNYPLIQLLIAIATIFIICIITPKLAYKSISQSSVVERLRESE